ncbi:class III extradiol ring-cleavage dioxygenase [Psychrosphaera aquimarina]|uniref:Class III extradiol ring-cleavage dioxygenase n=1 Tax=Psychrosphaera aquimarina TaxID=2044854 RepID=A0ABU3QYQ4_9GAMM|nr:class III extradiol ring-cleavage dioxygenase [Psychrosphaera aquimarina]MDU0112552.1 class III extradiol ring-cleavage dioxygenase [Psychrosphaera aquimarina]
MNNNPKALFISHGGGPMPLLGDEGHNEMIDCLQGISNQINKPSGIIVISAHWEEQATTITANASPSLIYDYSGFPKEAYDIQYACKGMPLLAEQLHGLFGSAGIKSKLDTQRGFDHGVFVPLKIMFPDADIPCIQVSLVNSLDPKEHLKIGQAIKQLDVENLLVIGSGFTFHNMKAFFAPHNKEVEFINTSFEHWLLNTCSNKEISESERVELLTNWEQAPGARYCHPREEHLLPLHVCYGVAQSACSQTFEVKILNKKSSMYLW